MASEERGMVSGSGDDQQKEILPMEASRERVESLWRQVLNQRSTGRPDQTCPRPRPAVPRPSSRGNASPRRPSKPLRRPVRT